MIAPKPREGIHQETKLGVLLRKNLLVSTLIFSLLELWRPYFFLTDDNLDGTFPFFTEMGQNLLHGMSPFVSHHLFGGHYNLLRDPAAFNWHPGYLLVSLLAGTPWHNAIVDVDAYLLMMLATAGFVVLAHYLRREYLLAIHDGWIMFFALSYTYSMIALTTGASWLNFLGDHSALPWLALGILQRKWTRGLALIVIFVLHQTLGGHLLATTSNSIFLSFFALGISVSRRSLAPLATWLGGYLIAIIIVSPLLIPMLGGFAASYRAQGVTLADMQANNIPMLQFPSSLFLGMALWLTSPSSPPYATYTLALGASAAAWCLIPALAPEIAFQATRIGKWLYSMAGSEDSHEAARAYASVTRRPGQEWHGVDTAALGLCVFGAFLIARPLWVSEIMMHLPLFRSMRWPFREEIQFQFFLHLFLLARPPGFRHELRMITAVFGTCVLVIPLVFYTVPPTFNAMTWDRELVLTGGTDLFWAKVRPLLKPTDRIAVLIPFDVYTDDRFEEPYSLLGSYNYAELVGVINAFGYSPTVPRDQVYTKTYAYYPFGAYRPEQKRALMKERPDLKYITLESLRPLKITLSSSDGPTIDLTPFVPKRLSIDPRALPEAK